MNKPRTAAELSKILQEPFAPTAEQARVIESPLAPALVVAGAGSGKTTTMADRVAWLVSEQGIQPDQILGLTFTRKATQELKAKIHQKLKKIWRHQGLAEDAANTFAAPTISTYNSFANSIFRDNALLVGREPESELLTEAAAWTLAKEIVYEHGGEELSRGDYSASSVITAVLELSQKSVQYGVTLDQLHEYFANFQRFFRETAPDLEDTMVKIANNTPQILELVERYILEKQKRNLVEYSDQVALAYEIVSRGEHNPVRELLREQYKVVLLDEYQDTTVSETRLLSAIFNHQPIMAVGDPYQSIYGWRGASAGNLATFRQDFGVDKETPDYTLSISWRNDEVILKAANIIAEPLKKGSGVTVKQLCARPGAGPGEILGHVSETSYTEAEYVAEWFQHHIAQAGSKDLTMAILVRKNAAMQNFAESLHARGIPYEISNLGGLVHTPEVADIISALSVISDPFAGGALIRLLTGGCWQIGLPDLKQLKFLARQLGKFDESHQEIPEEILAKAQQSGSLDSGYSIVDALDFIAASPESALLNRFTETGRAQLLDAANMFARLRRLRSHVSITELIQHVIEELQLDIELYANELRNGIGNLARFRQEVGNYLRANRDSTLQEFLEWVEYVSEKDTIKQESPPAAAGKVQLLSMHAAKGLEWDIVAIPQMNDKEFPSETNASSGWLSYGEVPYPLRADAEHLPKFLWEQCETRKEITAAHNQFKEDSKQHNFEEERRLAYVAITRARHSVLMTAVKWKSTNKTAKKLSKFYEELLGEGILPETDTSGYSNTNPAFDNPKRMSWPADPLGYRRQRVETAAKYYATHVKSTIELDPVRQREIDYLIEEHLSQQEARPVQAQLPNRIPASQFRDFVEKPEQQLQEFARPMPQKPYRATRLGTEFHAYVEERALQKGSQELFDSSWFELDTDPEEAEQESTEYGGEAREVSRQPTLSGTEKTDRKPELGMAELRNIFAKSEWGNLQPLSVEEEIQLPLAGKIVICKIDAVYKAHPESEYDVQIVDWKTGKAPKTEQEKRERLLQIHLYRLAYAELHQIPLEKVDAVLYYVASNEIIRSDELMGREELENLWKTAWQKP